MEIQYLLDTNICVFILRGKYNLNSKVKEIGIENCCISEITIAELLYGAECSNEPEKNKKSVIDLSKKFRIINIYPTLETFGYEKSKLRFNGNMIDDFDLLIASSAIYYNLILVTDNLKHFKRLDIKLENWIVR